MRGENGSMKDQLPDGRPCRRNEPRFPVSGPAKLKSTALDDALSGMVVNMSAGGALLRCVVCPPWLGVGSKVTVELFGAEVSAVVRHVTRQRRYFLIGVMITDPLPAVANNAVKSFPVIADARKNNVHAVHVEMRNFLDLFCRISARYARMSNGRLSALAVFGQ